MYASGAVMAAEDTIFRSVICSGKVGHGQETPRCDCMEPHSSAVYATAVGESFWYPEKHGFLPADHTQMRGKQGC